MDVPRLRPEQRGVVLPAYRDDETERLVAEPVEERAKHVEVLVVDGAERDVDDRPAAQGVEPGGRRGRRASVDRADALHGTRHRIGHLEAGRAHVEIEVAIEATERVWREPV